MAKRRAKKGRQEGEYEFVINVFTPTTIPMSRLAEYMLELAKMVGHHGSVHFQRISRGSAKLKYHVDTEDIPKVATRLELVRSGDAPPDAAESYRTINKYLRDDNSTGALCLPGEGRKKGAIILDFPGKNTPVDERIGPFSQNTVIQGELIRIGGRDKTAHALICDADGRVWSCAMTREKAREASSRLYRLVRVEGKARWTRTPEGVWECNSFRADSIEPIEDSSLLDAVKALRNIEGNEWADMDDPLAALRHMREDDGEAN